MNKIGIMTGVAAIAALLPAGIGLAANPSFQAEVPIASVQSTRTPGPSTSPTSDDRFTHDAGDDRGGDRVRTDDGVGHDAGDDHGGDRVRTGRGTPTSSPTTSPDDHGGDRPRSSTQDDHGGSTSGSDDSRSGKHGSGKGESGSDGSTSDG